MIFVKMLDSQKQTSKEKLCSDSVTNTNLAQEIKEISSLYIVEKQIHVMTIFVGINEFDNEGTIYYLENLFLVFQKSLHLISDNYIFLHTFKCKPFLILFALYQEYSSHLSLTQSTQNIKIFNLNFSVQRLGSISCQIIFTLQLF